MPFLVLAALAGAVLFTWPRTEKGAAVLDMTKPRGIRLNNPGNIRHGDNWQGMAPDQPDPSFVYFVDPRFGYRAMVKVLQSYARRGVVTVSEIIATWAPPEGRDPVTGEIYGNHTDSYIRAVASRTGLDPDQQLDLSNRSQVTDFLAAMTLQENGQQPYDRTTIERGYDLA